MLIDKAKALAAIQVALDHKAEASGGTAAVEELAAVYEACIERWAPEKSSFRRQADAARAWKPKDLERLQQKPSQVATLMRAPLLALKAAYQNDAVGTFEELVHANVFADLLSQATYLHGEKYYLPAAVIAGASLEAHLRALAPKHGVALDVQTPNGPKPKMASALNTDLRVAGAYSLAQEHTTQGWITCRNDAAHGNPDFPTKYNDKDIEQMISGVRDFIVRYPA